MSPLSGDDGITFLTLEFGDIASWSSRSCSNFLPSRFAPITLRSNRWPGAIVVAHNDKFTNVYIGDGQKNLGNPMQHFIVPKLPDIQVEYGADVLVENDDPTVEEEKAFEDSQKVKEEEVAEDGEPNDDGEEKEEEEED